MSPGTVRAAIRERYGAGPLHLLAAIGSFAIAGYAFLEIADRPAAISVAAWFGGAIIAHDLIAFPLYSLLGLIAGHADHRLGDRATVNWFRIPALLSALAFIVWFPFILGLSESTYELASGRSTDPYLGRWLLLSGVLFAGSGLIYAIRARLIARASRPDR